MKRTKDQICVWWYETCIFRKETEEEEKEDDDDDNDEDGDIDDDEESLFVIRPSSVLKIFFFKFRCFLSVPYDSKIKKIFKNKQ